MGGLRRAHAGDVLVHDDRPRRAGRGAAAGRLLEQGRRSCTSAAPTAPAPRRPGRLAGLRGRRWSPSSVTAWYATRLLAAHLLRRAPAAGWPHPHEPPAADALAGAAARRAEPRCSGWPASGAAVRRPAAARHRGRGAGSEVGLVHLGPALLLPLALLLVGAGAGLGWLAARPGRRPGAARWVRCGRSSPTRSSSTRPARPGRTPGAGARPRGRAGRRVRWWTARSRAPAAARVGLGGAAGRAAPGRLPRAVAGRARRRAAARPGRRRDRRAWR